MKENNNKKTNSYATKKYVSPQERKWLNDWLRESLYDERMERQRERWLGQR